MLKTISNYGLIATIFARKSSCNFSVEVCSVHDLEVGFLTSYSTLIIKRLM